MFSLPIAPDASSSFAFAYSTELTRWLPIWIMRFVAPRRLDHLRPVGVEMDHRLLAVHVLAGLHRIHRRLLVPVIRRADDHRVNVFARKNLVVVARRKDIVAPELLAAREPPVIAVRHRHQLHARHLHRRLVSPMPCPPAPISAI